MGSRVLLTLNIHVQCRFRQYRGFVDLQISVLNFVSMDTLSAMHHKIVMCFGIIFGRPMRWQHHMESISIQHPQNPKLGHASLCVGTAR